MFQSRLIFLLCVAVCLTASVQAQPWSVPTALQSQLAAAGNDAHTAQNFAQNLAIDGDWLAIGANFTSVEGRTQQGAVYVFRRVGDQYQPVQRVVQPDGQSNDLFGNAVALKAGRLIVGAPGTDVGAEADRGRVLVYTEVAGQFVEQQRLVGTATDAGDRFGQSVAFDGQVLAVGAPYAMVAGVNTVGAAFAFALNGNSFASPQRLEPASRVSGDAFGWSVAVDANTIAVGAPTADVSGLTDCGAVTVFVSSSGTFALQQTLQMSPRDQNDWFGWSLALNGDRLFVGAPFDDWSTIDRGSVQPFVRSSGVWTSRALIQAPDAATQDLFGFAVASIGDDLVIGARDDSASVSRQGSVYQYRINPSLAYQRKLTDSDSGSVDLYGGSLALSAGQLAVGARLDDVGSISDTGSASVYALGTGEPLRLAKLSATRPVPAGEFGRVLAALGDDAFVGMPSAATAGIGAAGAVDWFRRQSSGQWQFMQRFVAANARAGDAFGAALTFAGEHLIIGAPGFTEQAQSAAGAIYLLSRQGAGFTLSGPYRDGPPQAMAQFGAALAADSGQVLIGVPGATVAGQPHRGVVLTATVSVGGMVVTQSVLDPAGAAGDRFGQTLAQTATHVAIGAPLADVAGASDAGKVVLYTRGQSGLQFRHTHVADPPQAFSHFGASLASSARLLAIGAPDADGSNAADQGQLAWVDWSAPDTLRQLADAGQAAGASFASALAVHGGLILAASSLADVGDAVGAGRVSMWMSNGAELVQVGELVSATPETGAGFGSAVQLSGNRAFLASPFADQIDAGTGLRFADVGSVQVFEPDAELVLDLDNGVAQLIQDFPEVSTLLLANIGTHPVAEVAIQAPLPQGLAQVKWSCTALNGAACPIVLGEPSLAATVDLPAGSSLLFQRQSQVVAAAGTEVESLADTGVLDVSNDDQADNADTDRDLVVTDLLLRDSFEQP